MCVCEGSVIGGGFSGGCALFVLFLWAGLWAMIMSAIIGMPRGFE